MAKIKVEIVPVFPVHPEYEERRDQWQRCRDILEGSDAVKDAGEKYLPKLSGQTLADYEAYKQRALFFGISGRILSTNSGVIVRRSPKIKFNDEKMKEYFKKDSINFLSFNEIFRKVIRENLSVGRVATYVDVKDNRAIPVIIKTENIINWAKNEDGDVISILLMLFETKTNPVTFDSEVKTHYYRLYLDSESNFWVTKYDEKGVAISNTQPSVFGKTLKYIPFVCANVFGIDISPVKSPMLDIVDINISHYQTSADLENGRHFVGLPTPYVTGGTSDAKLRVGETTAWVIPNDKAKVGYLEFLGQGLDGLSKALQEKQSQMSQFSAQLMDSSSKGSEAEGTVRLRYSSDAANLSDIALSAETLLNTTYKIIADWMGYPPVDIELNRDFISTKMSYQELLALHKARIEGSISEELFNYNLLKGEIKPSDMDNKVTDPQNKSEDQI